MNNALQTSGESHDAEKIDREIHRVAASIRKFRVEAQRFFAGDRKLPPEGLREKIAADLRRLRAAGLKGAAASFRLGTLEAQFQSHLDLFGRRLRERELSLSPSAAAEGAPRVDPARGVVVGSHGAEPAIDALYDGLGQTRMDRDRFRSYIQSQVETIRAKTGCREVQFRLAVEGGKTKLKAKPLRRPR